MVLYHKHNSGKHVNKRQPTILKSKPKAVGKLKLRVFFSCTVENTNFESKVV